MKTVRRGNKQMRIADDRLDDFLAKGYAEIDQKTGKPIIKKPVDEVMALKKENADLKKANKELTEQLAVLTGKTAD